MTLEGRLRISLHVGAFCTSPQSPLRGRKGHQKFTTHLVIRLEMQCNLNMSIVSNTKHCVALVCLLRMLRPPTPALFSRARLSYLLYCCISPFCKRCKAFLLPIDRWNSKVVVMDPRMAGIPRWLKQPWVNAAKSAGCRSIHGLRRLHSQSIPSQYAAIQQLLTYLR